MNPVFYPPAGRNTAKSDLVFPVSDSNTSRIFLPQIVNQQIPQNEHLQNSIKTNSFNSFTINTYEKPGEGGVLWLTNKSPAT
jgi:hypothetical protein